MIVLNAQVQDENTGQGLANAVIYSRDDNGNLSSVGRSDQLGGVTVSVSENVPTILVTAPGFAPKEFDTGEIDEHSTIQLTPASLADGQATQIVRNTTPSSVPWWVWVSGAGLVLYATSDKKSKKIGDGASSYILPIGIIIAGYFILNKFGLFGDTAGDQNADSIAQATLQGTQDAMAAEKDRGGFATMNASAAATLASSIYNAGTSDPVDQDAIVHMVIEANTLSDLLLMIQAFGTKKAGGTACSLFGNFLSSTCSTYTLPSFLQAVLDQQHLNTIRGYLSQMNIIYQL